jgi:hypothetical protein
MQDTLSSIVAQTPGAYALRVGLVVLFAPVTMLEQHVAE